MLNEATISDPSHEGRERLRGAYSIAVSRIRPDPGQPRREFPAEEMEQLTASVRQRGIRQPVRVWYSARDNLYQIVSGERRYRAAVAAGHAAVPCIVEETPTGQVSPERRGILVDQLVENWQRMDLNPYELSDALVELRDRHGINQKELAGLIGKPESEISRLLSLQRVDSALQQELRSDASGQLTRRHMIAVAQVPVEEQRTLVDKVRSENLTALETERQVAGVRNRTTDRGRRRAPGAIRRFAVATATIQINFRKHDVSDDDVIDVLRKVVEMVQGRRGAEPGNALAENGSPVPMAP